MSCGESVIRCWSYLIANMILCLLQDALPPPPPPPPPPPLDGAPYSFPAGQSPPPTLHDQKGRQRPTVLRRRRSILIGCRTETIPQHKRPKWETKTHSVSYKNSPTQKYAVFLNVQWNVRSGLQHRWPRALMLLLSSEGEVFACLQPPPPTFSCQCEAAQCEHVLRWRGQNLWMTVSWVPLEILWLLTPSPLASLLLQDTTHLMRIRCTHACRHLRLPVRACQTLRHPCSPPR